MLWLFSCGQVISHCLWLKTFSPTTFKNDLLISCLFVHLCCHLLHILAPLTETDWHVSTLRLIGSDFVARDDWHWWQALIKLHLFCRNYRNDWCYSEPFDFKSNAASASCLCTTRDLMAVSHRSYANLWSFDKAGVIFCLPVCSMCLNASCRKTFVLHMKHIQLNIHRRTWTFVNTFLF